jgi:hypothetical protein
MNAIQKIAKVAVVGAVAMASSVSAQIIWDDSWGGGTAQGGWWYGAAENGAKESFADAIVCGSTAWAAGDETDQFGDYCLNGSTMEATVNITKGTDAAGDSWGFALIGVDIEDGKTPYNALSAGGISVTHAFSSPTNIVVKTPNDLMGDGYQKKGVRGNASVFIAWGDLNKNTWSPAFDFDPSQIESIHFKVESEGTHTIGVSCIAFGQACAGGVPVLGEIAGQSINYALNGKKLNFQTETALQVEVFDLQGRMVAAGAVSQTNSSLSLSNLSHGSYIVRAMGANVNLMQKIAIVE